MLNKHVGRNTSLQSHTQSHRDLQASEHLRRLHMRNMVVTYCKRVQPEWKKQVCGPKKKKWWSRSFHLPVSCVICSSVSLDAAEGHSQWDLQGSERQLPTECWEAVPGLQAGYVLIHAPVTSVLNDEIVPGNTESTKVSLLLLLESEQINLKVAQTLGNDKVQVGFVENFVWTCGKIPHDALGGFQYGVPVIKYDRRGFKPRPRQLLLTNTFAVLVDRTKIKQRFDYAALRGKSWFISLVLRRLCAGFQDVSAKWDTLMSSCVHNVSKVLKGCVFFSQSATKDINLGPKINWWVAPCHVIPSASGHCKVNGRSLPWGGYSSAINHSSVN